MQKVSNRLSIKNIYFIILIFLFLFSVIRALSDLSKLIKGNYIINTEQIVRIDNFVQQGKADHLRSSKNSFLGYELKSKNGYSFTIKDVAFEGIKDRDEFDDILKHHNLTFIAYSDKLTLDHYLSSKEPIGINILQFKIGEEEYIDLQKGNSKFKRKLLWLTIFELVCSFVLLVWLLKIVRSDRGVS